MTLDNRFVFQSTKATEEKSVSPLEKMHDYRFSRRNLFILSILTRLNHKVQIACNCNDTFKWRVISRCHVIFSSRQSAPKHTSLDTCISDNRVPFLGDFSISARSLSGNKVVSDEKDALQNCRLLYQSAVRAGRFEMTENSQAREMTSLAGNRFVRNQQPRPGSSS